MIQQVRRLAREARPVLAGGGDHRLDRLLADLLGDLGHPVSQQPRRVGPRRLVASALGDRTGEPRKGAAGRLAEAGGGARVTGWPLLAHDVQHRVAIAVHADVFDGLRVPGGRAFLPLLAARAGGDLAKRVRLPRITGALLIGFATGPAWLGLIRRDEVDALQLVADAAVALIALAAGAELTLETVRAGRAALARLATGAIVFPFAVVTLVAWSVSRGLPIAAHQPWLDRLAVALVLGVLAAAASPVITRAMIDELRARGPFARSLLAVTVVQDVAVPILFAAVLLVCKTLVSRGALQLAVAGVAALQLAGSLAAGVALGALLVQYARLVRGHEAAWLAAAAFLAAAAARLLHLEPILIGLAAGCYLENVAPVESGRLRHELNRSAPVVYIIFFALAGAGLELGILAQLWPWALLLAGLRVVSLRYGLRWAGRHPDVTPVLARTGWLGLISQGGTAVVLAQLARRAFPEWGVSLETLLIAIIGVHEVAGPICFRQALLRAGEVLEGEGTHGGAAALGGGTVVASGGV